MRTMQPSVMIGSYTWARSFAVRRIHAAAREPVRSDGPEGWKAMLVYGDAANTQHSLS